MSDVAPTRVTHVGLARPRRLSAGKAGGLLPPLSPAFYSPTKDEKLRPKTQNRAESFALGAVSASILLF